MKINSLSLQNFRNYPELFLSITSGMVILTGPNAVGKTNFVEAIYFASVFKSFRDDAEYVFLKGTNNIRISVVVEKKGETHELDVFLDRRERIYANFKVDSVRVTRKQAQGFLRVVVFEPRDVDLFGKSPEVRRKYLSMVLSQSSIQHLDDLNAYKKVLSQKQKLLSEGRSTGSLSEDLSSWNEQLVKYGASIILARKEFVKFLNQHLSEVYSGITGFHRPVDVNYDTLEGETLAEIENAFREKLSKMADREIASGLALVGPHKDDFRLHSDGVYLAPFSSRGELRSQVLALKILELEYLSDGDDKPILLLDDVLSELDESRRTYFLKYLQGRFQTFITTTHPLELAAQHVTLSPGAEDVR